MAPSRPTFRDVGALLRQADAHARQAMAVGALVRQHLLPDQAQPLREDDLSLTGGFVESLASRLTEALTGDAGLASQLARNAVLAHAPTTRLLLARAIEVRLNRQSGLIGLPTPELPPRIESQVADAQDELSEAAMAVIIAQSRFLSRAQSFAIDIDELPPETLHGLVRLCVAWLQDQVGADPLLLNTAADALLQAFDERRTRPHRLMRFCHLFELPRTSADWALADTGPSLTMAMLERAAGLSADTLFDMVRDPGLARLAVVLRACGVDGDVTARLLEGVAALASLRPDDLPLAADLRSITVENATRLVAGWRNMDPLVPQGAGW
ncbi:hypothetical protein [Blastomonas natatoria]|nr:hypothetical protein [Blastomonas natatoria]